MQPDGTITLPLLGQVRATRRTVPQLRDELEERYKKFFRVPSITVTPIAVNTKLEDLLNTVDSRAGIGGGLQMQVTVTPAGDIQLPGVGSIFVQGLTLAEARQEIDARYDEAVPGVHVTLVLVERAKRFMYVLGEVGQPGRFELEGADDGEHGDRDGGRLEARREPAASRRVSPGRRLAADGHDARPARRTVRPPPGAGRRHLAQRFGHRAGDEDADPAGRRVDRAGLHARPVQRRAARSAVELQRGEWIVIVGRRVEGGGRSPVCLCALFSWLFPSTCLLVDLFWLTADR